MLRDVKRAQFKPRKVRLKSLSPCHVHILVHCTQSSGRYNKCIRGWKVKRDSDRQKESTKEREGVERKVGGGKGDFLVLCFIFIPPKKTMPLSFQPHPIKKIPFQTVKK